MSYSKIDTWSSSFLQTAILSLAMRRCRPIIPLSTVRMAFASWQATLERKLCKKVALVNSYSDRIQMKQARRTLQTHSLTKPNSNWKFSFTKKEVKYAHFPPFFPLDVFHSSSLFWHDVIVTWLVSQVFDVFEPSNVEHFSSRPIYHPPNPKFFSWETIANSFVSLLSRKKFVLVPFGHCAHQEREKSSGAFLSLPQGHYSQ